MRSTTRDTVLEYGQYVSRTYQVLRTASQLRAEDVLSSARQSIIIDSKNSVKPEVTYSWKILKAGVNCGDLPPKMIHAYAYDHEKKCVIPKCL